MPWTSHSESNKISFSCHGHHIARAIRSSTSRFKDKENWEFGGSPKEPGAPFSNLVYLYGLELCISDCDVILQIIFHRKTKTDIKTFMAFDITTKQ